MKKHIPLMVGWRIAGKRVLVVGGGSIAWGRTRALLASGAQVRVVAPEACDGIQRLARRHKLQWEARAVDAEADIPQADLVIAAVNDAEVSDTVYRLAREYGLPVHVADRAELCDFIFPAIHREGPLTIAISTAGTAPALAGRLRDHLKAALPVGAARALLRFDRLRRRVRTLDGDREPDLRMAWLKRLARRLPWAEMASWSEKDVSRWSKTFLADRVEPAATEEKPKTPARVQLVGSGPGDPSALTEAARRALFEADVVLADRLIPPSILALVQGELRVAPKRVGRADWGQSQLMGWMLEEAGAGRTVVRLKIGDPGLFGRAGEELEVLRRAGLRAEVLPGVSSVQAAAAAAGLSLTRRGQADRVWIGTGRGQGDQAVELPSYHAGTTYTLLMGVRVLAAWVVDLLHSGFPPDLPATIVCRASLPDQSVLHTTLSELPRRAAGADPPGVIFLGPTVGVQDRPDQNAEQKSLQESVASKA